MTARLAIGGAGLIIAIILGVMLMGVAVLVLSMIWTVATGG